MPGFDPNEILELVHAHLQSSQRFCREASKTLATIFSSNASPKLKQVVDRAFEEILQADGEAGEALEQLRKTPAYGMVLKEVWPHEIRTKEEKTANSHEGQVKTATDKLDELKHEVKLSLNALLKYADKSIVDEGQAVEIMGLIHSMKRLYRGPGKMAAQEGQITKTAYGPYEKSEAIITNIQQVSHQIRNAGFEEFNPETMKYSKSARRHLSNAENDIAEIKDLMGGLPPSAQGSDMTNDISKQSAAPFESKEKIDRMPARCNCETATCFHTPGSCPKKAGGKKVDMLGPVCDQCVKNYDPADLLSAERRGFPEEFVYDPTKKEHHYPRGPMKHRIKMHPDQMSEQIDINPDQLSSEDLHPHHPNFESPMTPEEWDGKERSPDSYEREWRKEQDEYLKKSPFRRAMITKSELLKLAEELEDPDNKTLVSAEDEELDKTAEMLVRAASYLRLAADEIGEIVPEPDTITHEKLDEMALAATILEQSDNPILQKQAAVIDDLLITLASPKNAFLFSQADHNDRISELKKKYQEGRERQHEMDGTGKEAVSAIEKSPVYKQYDDPKNLRPLQSILSQRTCIDHPGVPVSRTGENEVTCSMDHKIYNYSEGVK